MLDAPFLDRLTRGRAWIGLVAAGLIGIVFMQVSLLRLNAGIGRSIQDAQGLERQNAQLRDTVSRLGSGDRIQQVATSHGLVMPPTGTFHYLTAGRPGDAGRAARTMRPPITPIVEDIPSTPTGKASVGAATPAATPTPASTAPASTPPATTTTTAPTAAATTSAPATSTPAAGTSAPAPQAAPGTSSTTGTAAPPATQPAAPTSTPTTPPGQ